MKRRRCSRATAFTLIELLVVIAIIAVLAAALLPAVTGAQVRGLEADCSSTLKQLGAGLFQYATTRGGAFPMTPSMSVSYFGERRALIADMVDYVGTNPASWYCKRYLKATGLNRTTEFAAGNIGYYYWAWLEQSGQPYPLDMSSRTSYWQQTSSFFNTNISGAVLMSDVFWTAGNAPISPREVQFHGGTRYEVPLTQQGTLVLFGGGSVLKTRPR